MPNLSKKINKTIPSRNARLNAVGLLGGVHDVYQCENACLNVRDDNRSTVVQTEGGGHTIA